MIDSRIAETFVLPSQGKVYEEDVNPEVILSSMTTKHEMLRLSTNEDSQKLMADIIDDCIQNDVGISAYDMCLADYQYLMYKLRVVTFGPEYDMFSVCPYCGNRTDIQVDLDDIKVVNFEEPMFDMAEIELPKDGSVLTLTLQTPRMLDKIDKQVRQAKKKMHNKENPQLLYTIMNSIVLKDGEPFDEILEEQWLRELPLADTNLIFASITRLNNAFGLDLMVEHTCANCGEDIIVPFRVNETFFRPAVY